MSIAEERVDILFELAKSCVNSGEFDRSREYVRLARRISERNRCGLPREFKRYTCKQCDVALRPGVNARIRLNSGRVVIRCDCGSTQRYPYK